MITGIEGKLQARSASGAIIKVGGVSLSVQMPASALSALGEIGDKVQVFTHLQLREDGLSLYGFATMEELGAFRVLITVKGIGPRIALSILSAMSPEQLSTAVSSGNPDMLCHIPGVGKKTASRLLLELKDKIEGIAASGPTAEGNVLTAALLGLGYSAAEAASAVSALPNDPDMPLEEKIRLALQHFSSR